MYRARNEAELCAVGHNRGRSEHVSYKRNAGWTEILYTVYRNYINTSYFLVDATTLSGFGLNSEKFIMHVAGNADRTRERKCFASAKNAGFRISYGHDNRTASGVSQSCCLSSYHTVRFAISSYM